VADPLDWPLLEDQIVDYLNGATAISWAVQRDGSAAAPNTGGVRVSVGATGTVDRGVDVELTVVAATRTGMWQLTGQTDRAMENADFLSRSYIDEITLPLGWTPEDPGPTGLSSGTATYNLVVRRQPEPLIDEAV